MILDSKLRKIVAGYVETTFVYLQNKSTIFHMQTIIKLLENCVSKFDKNPYLWEKKDGSFNSMSYSETYNKVEIFAKGLIASGIKKNDKISLISEGRNDWVIAELGILMAGAVNVPLSVKLIEEEIAFRINHSESKIVIVSKGQLPK